MFVPSACRNWLDLKVSLAWHENAQAKETVIMKALLQKFLRQEEGMETVEYAIIGGIVVVATLLAIISISVWISGRYAQVDAALSTAP